LQATDNDLKVAMEAKPVPVDPTPAPQAELANVKALLNIPGEQAAEAANKGDNPVKPALVENAAGWKGDVKQWQPDWIQYDQFYRPVIFNPYPNPLQVIYNYGGVPRVLMIPPLGSIVTEAATAGAYNFTAMLLNGAGIPSNVAVGNFFGGGYEPKPGQPPPPPPPPVKRYDDVPVVVKYADAQYKPIRVQKIVDVGDDPAVGERKVLLDGVTPAWGQWVESPSGEQTFEVHKTQQFPGMEEPQEGPLPGDYQLQLVSDEEATGMSTRDMFLIGLAAVVALLGAGAIGLTVFLGRRRRLH
jgi:hypothetical protein